MAKWLSQLRSVPKEKIASAAPLSPLERQIFEALGPQQSGAAWGELGPRGVVSEMANKLREYGINDLGQVSWGETQNLQPVITGDDGRKFVMMQGDVPRYLSPQELGQVQGQGGEEFLRASDGMQSLQVEGYKPNNTSIFKTGNVGGLASDFGTTWAGKGGTGFQFTRDPETGKVRIGSFAKDSNDKGDIMGFLSVLGAAFGAQALTGAGGGAGAAAGGAGEAAAAGAADIGMASFGQVGIPSAIPAGAGYGSLGVTGLSAPVSTFGAGFGGGAIGSGLAASLAASGAEAAASGTAAGGGGGGGAGGGGATPPATPPGGPLGTGSITGSKLGDAILTKGAGMALTSMLTPDAPDAPRPQATPSGKSPEAITKAVSEMPDPLAQQRARRRSLTEQLGRRGRASTIMTKPSGRLGG